MKQLFQPQGVITLDRGPWAEGLKFAAHLRDGFPSAVNLVTGAWPTSAAADGAAFTAMTPAGQGTYAGATLNRFGAIYAVNQAPTDLGTDDFTVACYGAFNPTFANPAATFMWGPNANNQWRIQQSLNDSTAVEAGAFAFATYNSSDRSFLTVGASGVITGRPQLMIGRRRGTEYTLWVDGVVKRTNTFAPQNISNATSQIIFGSDSSGYGPNATLLYGMMWRAALADSLITELAAQPWGWTRDSARRGRVWVQLSAANDSDVSVTASLPLNSVTIDGLTPSISVSSSGAIVSPTTGSALWTGLTPTITVSNNRIVQPSNASIAVSGLGSSVLVGNSVSSQPGVGSTVITGLTPTVLVTAHKVVQPSVGATQVSGVAPTITASGNKVAQPAVGSEIVTGLTPTVSVTNHRISQPGVGSIVISPSIPVVVTGSVQFSRPISDVSNAGWTPSSGVDLYSVLDEAVPDDGDYIYSPLNPSTEKFIIQLGAIGDPQSSTGHDISLHLQAIGQDTVFTFELLQGPANSVLDTWDESVTVAQGVVARTRTLSPAVADSISNYADIRISGVAHA